VLGDITSLKRISVTTISKKGIGRKHCPGGGKEILVKKKGEEKKGEWVRKEKKGPQGKD